MAGPDALQVDAEARGERLDSYLTRFFSASRQASRSQVQAWIAAGHVRVDGAHSTKGHRLSPGERIDVEPPVPRPATVAAVALPLQVLFEDAHLLVLNKPAHLDVHPGAGAPRVTLVHALLAHCKDLSGIGGVLRPGIVHRLDRGTTGAIVVAKHDAAHRHLAAQFAGRTVRKTYLALVHGPGPAGATGPGVRGRRDTPYGRHRSDRKRFSGAFVASGGPRRRAVTDWQLIARLSEEAVVLPQGLACGVPGGGGRGRRAGPQGKASVALLACTLHTGRTHQLRVHLAELGWPIVGDTTYGPGRPLPSALPAPLGLVGLDHQALHAWRLAFVHPVDHRVLQLEAPLPATWAGAVAGPLTSAASVLPSTPEEPSCA